ncbi:MAG: L-threonylcarbamoyladenylate synthase [Verrucomicrobiota bacterium]
MANTARVLATSSAVLFEQAVAQAAAALSKGEVVALPTETVYGLAANALNAAAVQTIFQIKGRPAHNPIIVHVADLEMARQCVARWPAVASRLAAAFWPGPLTLVLNRSAAIPDLVTAGGPTVGVRWPAHPFIQAVIRRCGFPLAAPSANTSNQISPTSAAHVVKDLGNRIALVVDGGQCQVGIESTVLDISTAPARILRPGMIHEESLRAVLGPGGLVTESAGELASQALRSPGQLPKHYSPKARLWLREWETEKSLGEQLKAAGLSASRAWIIAHTRIPSSETFQGVSVIPHDPVAFARAIYAELHRCDAENPEVIVVEQPPGTPPWRAIMDRLTRASAK